MIVYLITAAALLVYLILVWFLGSALGLKSPDIWILRGGLAFIGIAGAAVFVWYWIKKQREKPAASVASGSAGGGDELDMLLAEAETKLGSSRLVAGASFGALPVIFLAGSARWNQNQHYRQLGARAGAFGGTSFSGHGRSSHPVSESVVFSTGRVRRGERPSVARSGGMDSAGPPHAGAAAWVNIRKGRGSP